MRLSTMTFDDYPRPEIGQMYRLSDSYDYLWFRHMVDKKYTAQN